MDFLFGETLWVRFLFAFIIVLALIGATAFLVRRFGAGGVGASSARGRQPRLAVIDAAAVDGRRRLILIRRDNVEHLLMIGGPSDVVVEANIVRAGAPARDGTGQRPAAPEALPRAEEAPSRSPPNRRTRKAVPPIKASTITNAKKNRTASGMSAPNRKSIIPPCAHGGRRLPNPNS